MMFQPQLSTPRRRPAAGFSLIELMVTFVVAALLVALAVPAFRSFLQNDQQWVQQNTLVLGLATARSEAIKRDIAAGVTLCSSTDGATCTGTPWTQGYIVVPGIDPANPAAALTPLQVVGPMPAGSTLTEDNNNLSITFQSNGAINATALTNPGANVGFTMCDSRGTAQARYSQVTIMGRVVQSPTVGQDLNGVALVCP
jgi:type IV fimbrial biogenesis protein FimT